MSENILEIKNLSVFFQTPSTATEVVKNISFNLPKGKILGIVGESGSGKSLTALSILGLLPYPKAFHSPKSSIKYKGTELINNSEIRRFRGKNFGFIFQEPMSSLNPLHTIGHQISENLLIHQKITPTQAKQETLRLLKITGIRNAEKRYKAYPHELSGGQRQRVMIAMAIANHPDILIADEPTTALDATIQKQIIDLLLKLKEEFDMSIIFISHDLRLIRQIADHVIVMKNGDIIESGTAENIFSQPCNEYTKTLISSDNHLIKNNKIRTKNLLEAQDITIKFPLEKNIWGRPVKYLYAVNKVSFSQKEKENIGIVGESGSGKTTLGQAICDLIKYEGKINIYTPKETNFHKNVQIIFQDPFTSLNPRMTIEQIIGEGLEVHFPHLKINEKKQRIVDILKEVGLSEDDCLKYPHEFSGGQRQRIAIARALVLEPKLLILDEPTSALDVTIQKQIIKLLQKIQEDRNITYIFISHDLNAVSAIADKIIVMQNGKIVEMNNRHQLFENPQTEYTKTLIEAFK